MPENENNPSSDMDPMTAYAELGRIDLASSSLSDVLATVTRLAKVAVRGADDVSVTLVSAGVAGTAAHTGELSLALDERQYESGYGPCLDAATVGTIHRIPDMATETRWPAFVLEARRLGVRSSLSVGIPVREAVTGGLNIYSRDADAFDEESIEGAKTFARYAAVALANAHLYEATAALADQMSEAMGSRAVIEQAKGIVMAQQGVAPQEAFDILARASQRGNRKLRDIAQAIVDGAQRTPEA